MIPWKEGNYSCFINFPYRYIKNVRILYYIVIFLLLFLYYIFKARNLRGIFNFAVFWSKFWILRRFNFAFQDKYYILLHFNFAVWPKYYSLLRFSFAVLLKIDFFYVREFCYFQHFRNLGKSMKPKCKLKNLSFFHITDSHTAYRNIWLGNTYYNFVILQTWST